MSADAKILANGDGLLVVGGYLQMFRLLLTDSGHYIIPTDHSGTGKISAETCVSRAWSSGQMWESIIALQRRWRIRLKRRKVTGVKCVIADARKMAVARRDWGWSDWEGKVRCFAIWRSSRWWWSSSEGAAFQAKRSHGISGGSFTSFTTTRTTRGTAYDGCITEFEERWSFWLRQRRVLQGVQIAGVGENEACSSFSKEVLGGESYVASSCSRWELCSRFL